ncbi:ABC transporter substrate-binding protein [Brevibacillus dissolubilis]|uniref:ABC transporter substrate-binding protein n=1 Tax=Brevibacillus dissolubilis TaxID=1844116 RepID=UPI00111777A6|nr:ABC transporter substrate-binding protein [Brevibacillus dissolubilis]
MKKKASGVFLSILSSALLLTACVEQAATPTETAQPATTNLQSVQDQVIQASDKSKQPEIAKKRTDTFIASISTPEGIFNPYFFHNGWDGNVTNVLFASLVSVDKEGKPVPQLAEKWDISDDQLTYTFHLKKGVTYRDGSPLTADDVAFTLTILHDKSYDGEIDISQAHIQGGQEYKEGKATSISGIKVIDPQTIQITTDKVSAKSLLLLGGPVLSKAYYGKSYKQGDLAYIRELHGKPLESGPYILDTFIPGQEVRFVANEKYFAGKPKVKNLIYKVTDRDTNYQLFQAGELDHAGFTANGETLEQLKALGFANIETYTASSYGFIDFNHQKPYFKDKKVRQAFIYGLNRQQILDAVYQGYAVVANIPSSPVSWAYTDDVNKYEYNPEKAKQLLDEAGWKVGADGIREKDGQKLKIRFLGSKSKLHDALIPIAKENFQELGISFEAEILDFNALIAKQQKGDYDLASFSTPQLLDPSEGVESFSSTYPDNNGYSNPKVDQLLKDSISTLDIEKRKPIYVELFKELNDDPPYIFLYNRKIMSAYSARITGLTQNTYTNFDASLNQIQIEK